MIAYYPLVLCTSITHIDGILTLSIPAMANENMMTSSNGNICGEFTGLRRIPRKKASNTEFDIFFDLRLNKRLSKQSWGWWFET